MIYVRMRCLNCKTELMTYDCDDEVEFDETNKTDKKMVCPHCGAIHVIEMPTVNITGYDYMD